MTSRAGRTASGQSAGLGPWSEAAGHHGAGHGGGTGPAVRRPLPALLRLSGPLWLWGDEKRLCPARRASAPAPARTPKPTSATCDLHARTRGRSPGTNAAATPRDVACVPPPRTPEPAFPGAGGGRLSGAAGIALGSPEAVCSLRMGHASPPSGFGERHGSDAESRPRRPVLGAEEAALPLCRGILKASAANPRGRRGNAPACSATAAHGHPCGRAGAQVVPGPPPGSGRAAQALRRLSHHGHPPA